MKDNRSRAADNSRLAHWTVLQLIIIPLMDKAQSKDVKPEHADIKRKLLKFKTLLATTPGKTEA